jgi:hypothetical protein
MSIYKSGSFTLAKLISGKPPVEKKTFRNATGMASIASS